MNTRSAEFKREYARRQAYARSHGLPTAGICRWLRENWDSAMKERKERESRGLSGEDRKAFHREYQRRYVYAKKHGLPTDGISRQLHDEWAEPEGKDTPMTEEEFAAHVHSALMKVNEDLKELAARRERQESEERERAEQRRQAKEAEHLREWAEYIKDRQCRTCFHEVVTYGDAIDERGCSRREARGCSCRLHPERSIRQTSPACKDYDDMYRNAIIDL